MSRGRLLLVPLAFCLLAGLFASVGVARTGAPVTTTITYGVTDDATKYSLDGGAFYFNAMADLGMTENRVNVFWDESTPATLLEEPFLDRMMATAATTGTRIVLAIQPIHALAFATNTRARIAAFTAYVRQVALRYPLVREYVIGNEPNVRRFFQPQHVADGTIVSAQVYEQLLAAAYDTLKSVDPGIRVDGLALSPRGNDKGVGTGAESVSPVRFIAALGAAYRQSGRTAPIADVVDVHAYSNINTQPLTRPYQWPQAGAADLDRLKQAWWDAFHSTPQPVFKETGGSAKKTYVTFRIDESGTQVKVDPTKVDPRLYSGRENVPTVDEATQARYYTQLIALVKCDPTVQDLDLFHLVDEPLLNGFQSGLLRVDDSLRPSYAAVKQAIAAGGTCNALHTWRHTTSVTGARMTFDARPKLSIQQKFFARAGAGEEATAQLGIFPADGGKPAGPLLRQSFAAGDAPVRGSGVLRANVIRTFTLKGRLTPGRWVFAVLVQATVNPERSRLLVSKVFTVR